jgi:hypothetical protein
MWQAQVLEIVKNLKSELAKAKGAEQEVKELKELLRVKDEEILSYHQRAKGKVVNWMKGLGRVAG